MIKFDMDAFLFDNEILLTELSRLISIDKGTLSRIKDRGTIKPSFLKHLRKFKFKYSPDVYCRDKK